MPFVRSSALPAVLALVLGWGLAGTASAQSLEELYQAARGYDATFLAARSLADSAQYRLAQTEALNRPSASLSASAGRTYTDPPPSVTNPSGASLNYNANSVSLQGKQPLFNRSNDATIEQAKRSFEIASADLESAEQDLIIRVSQAYFDVLAAQDTLTTTRTSKAAISEQLASAKRNFEVGTATITDTREAQARFDLGTAQEIAAENDLRTKRIALDTLVGRANVQPKGLATPVALPAVEPPAVDEWVLRADAQHPVVRKAQLGVDIAKLETEKARAQHLPTVDAVGSVSSSHTIGTTRGANIGVQLSVPLFAGFAIQNRVKETLVLEEKSRNDLEAARRGVAQVTRQAFFGVQSLQAQVKALEAAESSTQLALEATQLGYRVGVRVNLDVLNAQTQLFTTRRDLAKARYDVVLGSLKLRQAAGQLKPGDIGAVSRLLAP
jgi:outer membrane protein